MSMDWGKYPNFKPSEFACKHCGQVHMSPDFMEKLQKLRVMCGFPFIITSGYRCPDHPEERGKASPGAHAHGVACDIAVDGQKAYILIKYALPLGFTGVGVSQRSGKSKFIHLDTWDNPVRPNFWSY